jgi:hypothetical protein
MNKTKIKTSSGACPATAGLREENPKGRKNLNLKRVNVLQFVLIGGVVLHQFDTFMGV